jgi:general secretion pathway protein C
MLARLLWALFTPAGPVGTPPPAAAPAAIDPQALAAFDPFFRNLSAGPEALSSLDLILMGTRVDRASGRGSAIIALPDETQTSFAVGDEVLPGVRLAEVAFDSVVLDNGGSREALFLDQSMPAPIAASQSPADQRAPADQPRLAADLQAVPRMTDGQISGLILAPKGSGAAFAAAGLQAGDVLTRVDGVAVAALGDPAALARRLDAGGLTLDLERGGQPRTVRLGPGGLTR